MVASTKKALVPSNEQSASALAPSDEQRALAAPIDYSEYADDAGGGFENQTAEDSALPFLDIIHFTGARHDSIPGSKPGQIVNTATNQLFDRLIIVPATTKHQFLEWKPLDAGGGLVKVYPFNDPWALAQKESKPWGKIKLDNGNELIESFCQYVMFQAFEDDVPVPAAINFSSTRIKAYKQMVAYERVQFGTFSNGGQFRMPSYAYRWELTTELRQEKAQKWFVWKLQYLGGSAKSAIMPKSDIRYRLSKQLQIEVNEGAKSADMSKAVQDPGEATTDLTGSAAPF